jgi:hypothetical protein
MQVRSTSLRVIGVVATLGALIGSTAGCASSGHAAQGPDRTDAFSTSRAGPSGDQIALPVDAYAFTTPEQSELALSRRLLMGRCLTGFGFGYDADADTARNAAVARDQLQDFGLYGNKRRYGVADLATASAYGYHLATTMHSTHQGTGGLGDLTAAEKTVLTGTDAEGRRVTTSASVRQIPEDGCVGVANAALGAAGGTIGDAASVRTLASSSFELSAKDTKVTAAIRAWSTCMAGKGYHYATPMTDPGFDTSTKTVSAAEIKAARTDVACKLQTNLVEIWLSVEAAYQKQQIKQHPADFRKAGTEHDAVMKKAAAAIAHAR